MSDMTPEQEHAFYADPDNQTPQGPPVRRRPRNAAALPIRLPAEMLEQVRQRAAADDRSVSSWVRRAIEHELSRPA
jgi:predicted HicB family RNase H-like nuclease